MRNGQTLNIKQVERVCLRLRKYGLTMDDAEALAGVLIGAADTVVAVNPLDLVALMRPKRERPVPAGQRPEVVERRRILRESLSDAWPSADAIRCGFTVEHHKEDYRSLASAVQYRARKDGLTWAVESISDTVTKVSLARSD